MSRDVVKVSPAAIQWRISADLRFDAVDHEGWSRGPRGLVSETDKYRSIVQRYVDGRPWDETPLFTNIYPERLKTESVRGCRTIPELVAQYTSRVDGLFLDLKSHGWRQGGGSPIPVYLSHDNHLLMGNQGNHRIAMAQVAGLDHVLAHIVARHPLSTSATFQPAPDLGPVLPDSARAIPAMTTDAERLRYYELTLEQSKAGAVVELGAWLGAASAYIAAGMRDAKAGRAHICDRFVWKPEAHDKKAGGPIGVSQREAFERNLGPLMAHVEVHVGDVSTVKWRGGPVSLLICDAPKRIAEISGVLTAFADAMQPGSVMAWQDFAYFPSYDIPAAVTALGDRVEFMDAVYPGTTAVFRVKQAWRHKDVTPEALALHRWTPDAIERAWDRWAERLPAPMRPRFACGAAMFLCDIGAVERAKKRMAAIVTDHPGDVLPKWRYLIAERARLMQRYQPLVEVVARCA